MHHLTRRALTVLLSLFVFTATPAKAFELQMFKQFEFQCAPAESWKIKITLEFGGPTVIGLLPYDIDPYVIPMMPYDIMDKSSSDAADGKWHVCGYSRGFFEPPLILYLLRPRPIV